MQTIVTVLVGVAMIGVGVMHFAAPRPFEKIVPSFLPAPRMLVYVSGVAELAGGVGVLIPATRLWASWGLIALFVAVFPANIYQAVKRIQFDAKKPMPTWVLWARLPFQFVFIAAAYWIGH